MRCRIERLTTPPMNLLIFNFLKQQGIDLLKAEAKELEKAARDK